MATRSLWRSRAKLLALTTAAASGGATAAAVATSEDPATALKLCTVIPGRLARDAATAASIVFDYQYSLLGLPEDSEERARVKHEVHLRSALKLQDLCFKNGGVYIKIGQHIGQLEYLVPDEYVQVMRQSMLNKCPVSSFDQVGEVIKKELGETPDKIFMEFEPVPVASASLAQVHVARTRDGRKVAVKVQHSHMTDTAVADHATVSLIVNTLHRLFPSLDYRWLVDEIRECLFKELDFLLEAKNSEKCLDNFRKLSPHVADCVYAPKVYWNWSTSKLLVMEFMDAAQINDVKAIRGLGIQPSEVSKLVSQAFAEMMFKHGFVHCDPHAANLLVRPVPSKGRLFGRKKPQLILLDHGLYKELDVATRTNYANLWKALVFADAKSIKEYSSKLGAGDDLYALFAGILTMRPWNKVVDRSVDHLVVRGTDRPELQMYASQYFPQIAELLTRLPREILLLLKTNDCLRAVNNALVQGSSLETYFIIGKISSEAVLEMKRLEEEVEVLSSPVRGMKVSRPVSSVFSELICTNELCRSYAEACMDLCCEIGVEAIEPFHHNPRKTWLDKHVLHQIVELPVLEGSLQSDLILLPPKFTLVELVIHQSCEGSEDVPEEILKVVKEAELKPRLHWKSIPTEFSVDSAIRHVHTREYSVQHKGLKHD